MTDAVQLVKYARLTARNGCTLLSTLGGRGVSVKNIERGGMEVRVWANGEGLPVCSDGVGC